MAPEEMDLVELVDDVRVEPSWRVHPNATQRVPQKLTKGQRGMVAHRTDTTPPLYDVEFLDATGEPMLLAQLRGEQLRVVERDRLGEA